ncbi:hypothetical protein KUCAC02_024168, partial [Chaenocephalus aceratus]
SCGWETSSVSQQPEPRAGIKKYRVRQAAPSVAAPIQALSVAAIGSSNNSAAAPRLVINGAAPGSKIQFHRILHSDPLHTVAADKQPDKSHVWLCT